MIPVTRKEQYLNRLTGEEQAIPETPVTRTEQYLAKLCGMETEIPSSPITREEAYLAYLNGEDVTLPEPITRLEQFMAFAAEKSETKPTPLTREEFYWDKYQGGAVLKDFPGLPASIVTVTDALAKPLDSLKVAITPVQSGSGDPSPDNIRPISGWTGCNVTVSPTQDAEDGTTYTISFGEAGTVYGGTLDVVNGTLTVTDKMTVFDGSETNWVMVASGKILTLSGVDVFDIPYAGNVKCNMYIKGPNRTSTNTIYNYNPDLSYCTRSDEGYEKRLYIKDARFENDVEGFKTWISQNNLQFCQPLATPITYHLTPTEVQMLLGTNNLWADTGDILEGKYWGKKSSVTRAMLNTLRDVGEITPTEEPEENDER